MLPFRLTCLGPPHLVGPDGEPVRLRTRKHLGLLVYLAIEPSVAHRRDRLAALLWPEAELEEGRHSLATGLSVLRGRLGGDAFEATRDTIRLLPGRVVTDVAMLLAEDPLEHDTLVAGAFLEEFEIPRAPDFEHWVDTERARLLPLVHDHLVRRIDHCRRTGDTRRLEQTAEQLARLDGLSEHAIRAQVEARAMAGDRIGALRIFDRWRTRVAEELGAGPGRELERMTDRLRRRGLDRPSRVVLAPVPTEQWQERVFVGRSGEYQACYRAWERVQAGEPRHLLVRGESGIGKTTLVGRVATSLALEGASIARVQGYELERELPFGVIGSLVAALIDLPGAGAVEPEQLAELGRLVPRVRQRWPTLPAPSSSTGEGARIQFTEAVMALIAALAEEHPVVLVIDDLHLADATSLAVLHLILRRTDAVPLMVMMTTSGRDDLVPPAAERFVAQAAAIRTEVIGLGPLPEVHATELLELLLGAAAEPGPTVRRALLAGAAGNPMLLELLVGDWRRRGEGSLALAVSAMTAEAVPPPAASVGRLVEGMLEALDHEARAVADLAAILGQRLNELAMYTLVDLPVARTMRAMTTLAAQRLLRDAGSHLEFTNEVVRSHCYLAMAAPLRRMLHSLVADRLIAGAVDHEPIPGLEVAWHLVRADRLGEAVPYLLSGGREAIRRGAPHEADLALSTGLPALRGAARRTAILLLAEALQELGRWSESLRVLEAPEERFEGAEAGWREVLRVVGRRWAGLLTQAQCAEDIEVLAELAQSSMPADIRVKALAALPYLVSQTRDASGMDALAASISSVCKDSLEPYEKLHYILAAAWWNERRGNIASASTLLEEGCSIITSSGFAGSVAIRTLVGAAAMELTSGRYSSATPLFESAHKLASRLDNPIHVATTLTGLAVAAGRQGLASTQIGYASTALANLAEDDWGIIALAATYERALGLIFEHRENEARITIEKLDSRCPPSRPPWARQAAALMKADVLRLLGDQRRALASAKRAFALGDTGPLIIDLSGPYWRWRVLAAIHDGGRVKRLAAYVQQALSLPELHEKDRAEVLSALTLIGESAGLDTTSIQEVLQQSLRRLPRFVSVMLRRLGMPAGGPNPSETNELAS